MVLLLVLAASSDTQSTRHQSGLTSCAAQPCTDVRGRVEKVQQNYSEIARTANVKSNLLLGES